MNRVGCYVRVSTENQLENYSIEEQIERLKAYCVAKNWSIYKIYTDGGYSGGNTVRPALVEMLNDIRKHLIDMVVVYKLDRLSRSQKDTLLLIEDEFLANNIDFVSVNENFDTSTPFGRAMIGILSVFSQLEKDQITERFTMGRIGRCKAGYYHGGSTAPTGYNYIDGELVIDEYKAYQVREVYERFLNGYSINSIKKYMHEKYGGWTSHTLIINILKNTVYIGKVKFKKQEYEGVHTPIVSNELFSKVQILLNSSIRENAKNTAQKNPFKANNLLTGLVYCQHCGSKYSGYHGYYKCYSRSKTDKKYIIDPNCKNKNWKIEKLDSIVAKHILKLKYDNFYVNRVLETENAKPEICKNTMLERLKEIDLQIAKMIDLYQIGSIPTEQIIIRVDILQKEKSNINKQLSLKDLKKEKQKFSNQFENFEDVYINGTFEEKRMFISNIIEKVLINNDTITIKWRV